MEEILEVLTQILDITVEMSPYLLLGFLLAGLMHVFIPGQMYSRYLADGSFRSVIYAALFGVPLPLCSCGVIPTAMSLRKEGASKGAAVSFLIATPQTGVDSIAATYSLMGLPFAIVRPIAAMVTALFGGQMVNMAEGQTPGNPKTRKSGNPETRKPGNPEARKPGSPETRNHETTPTLLTKLREALSYAFLEMMEDIGKWLVVGLIVAGLITALVPDSFFAVFKDNTLLSMLLVLAIAIPMYICATGSIPIAVALMMKGLTPGAALVMLMAGPACNAASMLVVNKVLGRRTLVVYLASIILGSVAFGFAIDHLLPAEWFVPTLQSAACCHAEEGFSWFSIGCTILLALLLINALWHHHHHPHCHCHENSHDDACGCHDEGCDCNEKAGGKHRKEFKISGMNCSHCRNSALKALQEIPGVTAADAQLDGGKAYVEGNVTVEQIKEALNALGFEYKDC